MVATFLLCKANFQKVALTEAVSVSGVINKMVTAKWSWTSNKVKYCVGKVTLEMKHVTDYKLPYLKRNM